MTSRPSPKVSVCVPSYNYARLIGRCIRSVLDQSYGDLELVVSDDASSDDSDAVIRSFCDERLVYVRQPARLGMTPNWRACLSLARGQYVLLLGADDFLKSTMIEQCVAALDLHDRAAFCHTAVEYVSDSGGRLGTSGAFTRSYILDGTELIEPFLQGHRVCNSASVFRRSCFDAVGGWSDDYKNCMDLDLWFRLMLRWKVAYIGEILTAFRSHETSIGWKLLQAEEDVRFMESMFERLPDSLAHLKLAKTEFVQQERSRRIQDVLRLPESPERDAVLARFCAAGGRIQPQLAENMWTGPLRALAVDRLVRLPASARFIIGDIERLIRTGRRRL